MHASSPRIAAPMVRARHTRMIPAGALWALGAAWLPLLGLAAARGTATPAAPADDGPVWRNVDRVEVSDLWVPGRVAAAARDLGDAPATDPDAIRAFLGRDGLDGACWAERVRFHREDGGLDVMIVPHPLREFVDRPGAAFAEFLGMVRGDGRDPAPDVHLIPDGVPFDGSFEAVLDLE